MDDGAAAEAESFIIEIENPVRLDVDIEEGVKIEVGLGIVVEGAVVPATGLVLVIILGTGGMLVISWVLVIILGTGEMLVGAWVLVIILVEGEMFEGVTGAAKAINSGLKTTIQDPVLRQFESAVSQTSPGKAEPQRVLTHIATAFQKAMLEHRQAFDAARVVIVVSGQPDTVASANKHG